MDAFDAIVLCAGLGTRLRPLTLETAKPAVPLLGRPLVGYAFALLKSAGFTRVCINTHWQPEAMRRAAASEANALGLELTVSHEPRILGTGGVFRKARDEGHLRRDRPLLVLNGDVLFDLDLPRLLETHVKSGASATMVLRAMPPGATYSPVEADPAGRIRRIGKYGVPGHGRARLFTGVHVLSPDALDRIPEGECGIVETVYAPLLHENGHIHAAEGEGLWLDLGDPEGYLAAHLELLEGRADLGALERNGILPRPVRPVAPTATIGKNAVLTRTSVGPGATVGDGATLTDTVIWPGAKVAASETLHRTIVTPTVRVAVPEPA